MPSLRGPELLIAAAGTAAVIAALAVLRKRRQRSTETLASLASFVLEEVLVEDELSVLLGRFAWQPAGEKALVKLSARRAPVAAGLGSLELALSSYSGAEYAYYNSRWALSALIAKPELRAAFALEVIAPASPAPATREIRLQPETGEKCVRRLLGAK